jgi:diguanylate cyclase (GGDEF)-like protein
MILEYPQKICIYTGWPAIRDAFTRVANASFTSGAQSSRERSFEATMADRANAKQMAAVLNAAGRAVSCAASVEALLQGLCEAAVREGGAQAACALLPDGDGRLRFVAGAGENPGQTGMIGAAAAQGEGAEGIARERSGDEIALPILRRTSAAGVFAFRLASPRSPGDPILELMNHLAEMAARALDNVDHEEERKLAALRVDRLDRRFSLLNATNDAILRARARDEMFQMVCDAATGPGKLLGASITLYNANAALFNRVACSGAIRSIYEKSATSADLALSGGRGVAAEVFQSGEPCFMADVPNDPRCAALKEDLLAAGVMSGAVMPLIANGRIIGVSSFFFGRDAGPLDEERVNLMWRTSENLTFGLEMFERQHQKESLARMFAALSATNEAIMRARTPAELFALVCDAAVKGSKFTTTLIGLARPDSDFLHIAATAGPTTPAASDVKLAVSEAHPEGRGITGKAFRSGRPCISNDYLAQEQNGVLLAMVRREGAMSGAALPLLREGRPIGVLLFMSSERNAFTPELVQLLERLAENVVFALSNFERADERRLAQEQRERLTRMFAALSATNEAIMRAQTRDELFRLVCDAAAYGGSFASAVIGLADDQTDFFRIVATAGPMSEPPHTVRLATNPAIPEGSGLCGIAFRTSAPCISNNYLTDERGAAFHKRARAMGGKSCAAVPLLRRGEAFGVLLFISSEQDAFTPELVELLQRLAENVAVALENFDRAEERRIADEHRARLTRMFAALSETNEAIMRAQTRAELFHLVCEAAVHGGRFNATMIALADPGSDFLRVVAAAGPKADMQRTVKIAVTDAYPEGRGLSGTAFRTLQPCITNDYLSDPRGVAFYDRARREGNASCASLPLVSHGRAAGVIAFMSSQKDEFTPDLVELLVRLANNVSFALDNFERAEEKSRADERIKYLATHDGLTDLPNRAMFNQLLRYSIEAARRYNRKFAVLFIDIDRFKIINDSLGHEAGDSLLVEIGDRLRQSLCVGDVVARLGGDEFVVIIEHASEPHAVEAAARRLLSVVNQPLQLCGVECRATASIGVAMFPADGHDEATLTKNADMAMYRAKEEGKNGFRFFRGQSKAQSVERLVIEARLRHALERNEFVLHYQPKVDVATEQITGVEALLRWTLPDLGVVSPMQFIPLAEETGLIVPIGRWVLMQACAQNMAWRRQGLPPMSMAVNLSPRQFSDENLLQDIDAALGASGMPAELLQIEITESMMMHNVGRAIELLDIIRSRGVRLAIDDFGTGYSSMSLMKKFPVDTIKIDRSFVQDLPHDSEDKAIAEAIISMGKALGLTVIAEGVETADQARFLREHDCDEMQGYLFSRPVPAGAIPELIQTSGLFTAAPAPLERIGESLPRDA